ncbi:pyridoxamine 5'-phosphate oxidase [Bacteroidota bacterium]
MSIMDSLNALRRDYGSYKFDENTAKDNPLEQFKLWFDEAVKADFLDVNAMVLSTADKTGKPSSRVVLLKNYDERGYVFFTNYESRKGLEITENPNASLLFFWDKLERQIKIEGLVEKITDKESFEYFRTRDYTSRLGAWASDQSRPLSSRFKLMRKVAGFMTKYPKEVPLPPYWGGYRLIPDVYEFWQGRKSRLHDRIKYYFDGDIWKKERLYP